MENNYELLKAWCHNVEQETLDEFSEDRKLMARQICHLIMDFEWAKSKLNTIRLLATEVDLSGSK